MVEHRTDTTDSASQTCWLLLFPIPRAMWVVLCLVACFGWGADAWTANIQIRPAEVELRDPEASQQLLVLDSELDGPCTDLTRQVDYRVADPKIARIDSLGRIEPVADGDTTIHVQHGGLERKVPVTVSGVEQPPPVFFADQVTPLLNKYGCNASRCHAKAEGQAGFKLSVFAEDLNADYYAIARQGLGRRVLHTAPENSLILLKATGQVAHGGKQRFAKDSSPYRRFFRWIAEGARWEESAGQSRWTQIEVDPPVSIMAAGGSQQLRVTAVSADGDRLCVTSIAEYKVNSSVMAQVDEQGLVQTTGIPGEVAVLVKFLDKVSVARLTLPQPTGEFHRPPENNFVDTHVWNKLQRLNVQPSGMTDDGPFLRRLYLDTIGTLPSSEEVRSFLANQDADKRTKMVEQVLQRQEYADYWTLLWSDLLRVNREKMSPQGALAMRRWLRRQFDENRPYDELVQEILTAQGSLLAEGPTPFYKATDSPEVLSRSVSQLFLGVRLDCAQCHHHPFEQWSQADYFAFGGFFTGLKKKSISEVGEVIVARGGEDLKHPLTEEAVSTSALGAPVADFDDVVDRRQVLVDWMTAPENPFFARMIANRLWAHYFGRGLVEPIDDMRETNPATNASLLDALAQHMLEVDYDLKAFTRTLLNSSVYQLDYRANDSNRRDQQNYSHAFPKTMPAEVLLDAISQSTGVGEKFNGWPTGFRAIQIWDNQLPSYFLEVFGRPARETVCSCERGVEPSIAQALHLVNSPEIHHKIHSHQGRAKELADSAMSPEQVIDELFLTTFCRFPNEDEIQLSLEAFHRPGQSRQIAVEDILWMLLNSKEFIYIR